MQSALLHAAPLPERRLPAWLFSIAFHGGMVVLLGMALERAPRGASEEPVRSAGIVLKRTSSAGTLYENQNDSINESATTESPEPQDNVAVRTDEARDAAPQTASTSAAGASQGTGQAEASPPLAAAGSPEGDSYTKVSVFGVQGTGSKFVYVFDRSASMEGPPLAAAKRQLIESLKAIEPVHQFHIIFFNHRLRSFDITAGGNRIAFGTERNKKLAANFIGGITADGGTDRFAALRQAMALRPDVIFFLTDADDPMSSSEMAEMERLYSRVGAAICVIEFGRTAAPPKENFLTVLARQSGGQYGYINTAKLSR
jgi:hypothetical protein